MICIFTGYESLLKGGFTVRLDEAKIMIIDDIMMSWMLNLQNDAFFRVFLSLFGM